MDQGDDETADAISAIYEIAVMVSMRWCESDGKDETPLDL